MLLVGIFIGVCSGSAIFAKDRKFSDLGFGDTARVLTDNETKQQYIVVDGTEGIAITPRLDGSGKVMTTK